VLVWWKRHYPQQVIITMSLLIQKKT